MQASGACPHLSCSSAVNSPRSMASAGRGIAGWAKICNSEAFGPNCRVLKGEKIHIILKDGRLCAAVEEVTK